MIVMKVADTAQIHATLLPDDASFKDIEWSSSDYEVSTVSQDGVVTALKAGKATITASTTDGSGLSASCEVTVYLRGDVNLDGIVDIDDINCIIDIIMGNRGADTFDRRDDVNGDGMTDVDDINKIIDMILGN